MEPSPAKLPAYDRFLASLEMDYVKWHDGDGVDLAALDELNDGEWLQAVTLLRSRPQTWRETEALAHLAKRRSAVAVDITLDLLRTVDDVRATADARLTALAALIERGRIPDIDARIATELRRLTKPTDGLNRALQLAQAYPTDAVKQALLWASWNQTDCAPRCAGLLCFLTGAAAEPFDPARAELFNRLGLHNSYFDRKKAFDELLKLTGMALIDA